MALNENNIDNVDPWNGMELDAISQFSLPFTSRGIPLEPDEILVGGSADNTLPAPESINIDSTKCEEARQPDITMTKSMNNDENSSHRPISENNEDECKEYQNLENAQPSTSGIKFEFSLPDEVENWDPTECSPSSAKPDISSKDEYTDRASKRSSDNEMCGQAKRVAPSSLTQSSPNPTENGEHIDCLLMASNVVNNEECPRMYSLEEYKKYFDEKVNLLPVPFKIKQYIGLNI